MQPKPGHAHVIQMGDNFDTQTAAAARHVLPHKVHRNMRRLELRLSCILRLASGTTPKKFYKMRRVSNYCTGMSVSTEVGDRLSAMSYVLIACNHC